MTKNNLITHLSWLVGSTGFAPPPPGVIPTLVDPTFASSSGSEDPLHGDPDSRMVVAPINGRETRNVRGTRSTPDLPHLSLQQETSANNEPTTMARLQSASKSNRKAKLLMQAPSVQLQTPNTYQSRPHGTSLKDQYTVPYERSIGVYFSFHYSCLYSD